MNSVTAALSQLALTDPELISLARLNYPAPPNSLLGLPPELRYRIYDEMFAIDARTYWFYVEGRKNLIIAPKTFRHMQKYTQLPRIARVCEDMREYTLDKYTRSTSFICAHFDGHYGRMKRSFTHGDGRAFPTQSGEIHHQMITKVYNLTAFFNFDCDKVDFTEPPRDYLGGLPNAKQWASKGSGRDAWLFAGSGLLDHRLVKNSTRFERHVWSERDRFIQRYPEVLINFCFATHGGANCPLGLVEIIKHGWSMVGLLRYRYWNLHAEFVGGSPGWWVESIPPFSLEEDN